MWWTYLTNKYLPIMNGLLIIEEYLFKNEKLSSSDKIKLEPELKKEFMAYASYYYRTHNLRYLNDDLEKLPKINMRQEYKEVIERDVWDFPGEKELNAMIKAAKKLCKGEKIDFKEVNLENAITSDDNNIEEEMILKLEKND